MRKKQAPHHSIKHHMDPLLFSVAVLLAASGAVKARATVRLGLGTPILSLAELFAAVVVAGVSVVGPGGSTLAFGLAGGGLLLMVVSSVRYAKRVRNQRRWREASEGRRLEVYLGQGSHRDGPSD